MGHTCSNRAKKKTAQKRIQNDKERSYIHSLTRQATSMHWKLNEGKQKQRLREHMLGIVRHIVSEAIELQMEQ